MAVTTADLVSGPSGIGLGAILFDGATESFSPEEDPAEHELQTFTAEMEVRPLGLATTQSGLFSGPSSGWDLTYFVSSQRVRLSVAMVGSAVPVTLQTAPNVVPLETWSRIVVVRDLATMRLELWVNRTLQASVLDARQIAYTPRAPIVFGYNRRLNDWFRGAIGFFRLSNVARDQRYINRAWYLMRRNPIEFLRELLTVDLRRTVGTTFDTEAAYVDGLLAAILKCDGYITDTTKWREIQAAFLPFLSPRLYRSAGGAYEVAVRKPATEIVAALSDANFELTDQVFSSLTEAVKDLPIHYRVLRTATGALDTYGRKEMKASVLDIGKEDDPLTLPLVWDDGTADFIRDIEGKRRRLQDELLTGTAGHEARRRVRPGKVVRVALPSEDIAGDYETMGMVNKVSEHDLALVPYDEASLIYVPGTLPTQDPVIDRGAALDMGGNPHIVLAGGSADRPTQVVHVTVSIHVRIGTFASTYLGDVGTVPAAGNNSFVSNTGSVDPVQVRAAVLSNDGDASYIKGNYVTAGQPAQQWFKLAAPNGEVSGSLKISLVAKAFADTYMAVRVRTYWTPGTPDILIAEFTMPGTAKIGSTPPTLGTGVEDAVSGTYHTREVESLVNPVTGVPWTSGEVATAEIGVEMRLPYATVFSFPARLTQLSVSFEQPNQAVTDFSGTAIRRKGPFTTVEEALAAPAPLETDTPLRFEPAFIFFDDYFPSGDGVYAYWAQLYDSLGRGLPQIGPATISVLGTDGPIAK